MLAFKVLIPLGALAATGIALALTSGDAKASVKEPEPGETKMPEDLQNKIRAAIGTADPIAMRAVADEVEKAGFPAQANALRAAADAIEKAMEDVDPLDPGKPGSPSSPTGPQVPGPVKMGRVIRVKSGEGPFQIAKRVFGAQAGAHQKELRDFNIPRDADGTERASDGAGGLRTTTTPPEPLHPGDRLLVPPSWPEHPDISFERIGVPAAAISGDDDEHDEDGVSQRLRRLAGRVALEVESKPKGKENRELVSTFQKAESRRGNHRGDCRGLFDAQTLRTIAICHGIVPPLRFADGKEIYWPENAAPTKKKVRKTLAKLAKRDAVRGEEWTQCAGEV